MKWMIEQEDGGRLEQDDRERGDGEEDAGREWSRMMDGRWREVGGECGRTGGGENGEDA